MGDVSSALVVRRGVTKSGKVMGRIGMNVFAISAGLEVTSELLFVRHLYQCIESMAMVKERMKRMREKFPPFLLSDWIGSINFCSKVPRTRGQVTLLFPLSLETLKGRRP